MGRMNNNRTRSQNAEVINKSARSRFSTWKPPTKAKKSDGRGDRRERDEKFELELSVIDDGRCNAIVFWYELHMGQLGLVTSAPSAAAAEGATRIQVGQALHFLPVQVVKVVKER